VLAVGYLFLVFLLRLPLGSDAAAPARSLWALEGDPRLRQEEDTQLSNPETPYGVLAPPDYG